MAIPYITDAIIKLYGKYFISEPDKTPQRVAVHQEQSQDNVTISEEGKWHMAERLKKESLEYLKAKV